MNNNNTGLNNFAAFNHMRKYESYGNGMSKKIKNLITNLQKGRNTINNLSNYKRQITNLVRDYDKVVVEFKNDVRKIDPKSKYLQKVPRVYEMDNVLKQIKTLEIKLKLALKGKPKSVKNLFFMNSFDDGDKNQIRKLFPNSGEITQNRRLELVSRLETQKISNILRRENSIRQEQEKRRQRLLQLQKNEEEREKRKTSEQRILNAFPTTGTTRSVPISTLVGGLGKNNARKMGQFISQKYNTGTMTSRKKDGELQVKEREKLRTNLQGAISKKQSLQEYLKSSGVIVKRS